MYFDHAFVDPSVALLGKDMTKNRCFGHFEKLEKIEKNVLGFVVGSLKFKNHSQGFKIAWSSKFFKYLSIFNTSLVLVDPYPM